MFYAPAEPKNTTAAAENNTYYLMNLTSGDRSVYERKAALGIPHYALAWGDNSIPIYGNITLIPFNKANLVDKVIIIKATQNGQLIYESFLKTDKEGIFNSSFFPPADGTITITANLAGENSTPEKVISVIATETWMPVILIMISIAGAIAVLVGFSFWAEVSPPKWNGIDKDPRKNAAFRCYDISFSKELL